MNVYSPDRSRRFHLNALVGLSGSVFLLTYGANALLNGSRLLSMPLFATAFLVLASLVLMYLRNNHRIAEYAISLAVVSMFAFLIATGGVDNTGPLWCYPLTLIILLLQGFKRGLFAVVLLLLIATFLLYVPDLSFVTGEYSDNFKSRFIGSFVGLAMMSLIYEYLRWHSNRSYVAISAELDRASRTDELTGLANRRDMQQRLVAASQRYSEQSQPFAIIMADLDHFKVINDRFGHALGDELLVEVGRCLSSGVRQQDTVARWGGEEFMILLPQASGAQAALVAEKLRVAVRGVLLSAPEFDRTISASFGVSCCTSHADLDGLLADVDRKLYEAKGRGRNRVVA